MGRDGKLPWHLPADLKHFRSLTIGKPVVMGRKTYASIGRPLAQRRNIVLTRDFSFDAPGAEIANSIQDVWDMTLRDAEIAIIGGADIFTAFAPYVSAAYVTKVEADVGGDVRYAAPERPSTCELLAEHPADDRNPYAMTFLRFDYS
jgi:dihydrofolate reductase